MENSSAKLAFLVVLLVFAAGANMKISVEGRVNPDTCNPRFCVPPHCYCKNNLCYCNHVETSLAAGHLLPTIDQKN
ncbi:hypothetical protein LINGRAHAP2_LOCUS33830 [Linum grandiflorum]